MPCTGVVPQPVIEKALERLERLLADGTVVITIAQTGAVALKGWKPQDRRDVSDVCAFRTLHARGSWALRQALAKAEQLQGRKVNLQTVAAGVHSHDGGSTWHGGH